MIVLGQSEAVARWVSDLIDGPEAARMPTQWYEAIGFLNHAGDLAGGVVYYDYVGHDIEAMAAGKGSWLTPLNVQAIFLYPFAQMGCVRMTCHVARKNHVSRKFVTRLGFTLEGKRRKGMADGQDAMIYGMLKSECKWIEGIEDHGQAQRAKAA